MMHQTDQKLQLVNREKNALSIEDLAAVRAIIEERVSAKTQGRKAWQDLPDIAAMIRIDHLRSSIGAIC